MINSRAMPVPLTRSRRRVADPQPSRDFADPLPRAPPSIRRERRSRADRQAAGAPHPVPNNKLAWQSGGHRAQSPSATWSKRAAMRQVIAGCRTLNRLVQPAVAVRTCTTPVGRSRHCPARPRRERDAHRTTDRVDTRQIRSKTPPGQPDQRIHLTRLTHGKPVGHVPNPIS
jgi:hypothetical protein